MTVNIEKLADILTYQNIKNLFAILGFIAPILGGLSTCHFQDEISGKDKQVAYVAQFYLDELIKCRNKSK